MDEQIALKAVFPEVVVVSLLVSLLRYSKEQKPIKVTPVSRLVRPDNSCGLVEVRRGWEMRVGVYMGWGWKQ